MVKIKGELYNITIEHERIEISPISVPSLVSIVMEANPGEDFSIFDLGPAIAGHVVMQTGRCMIGNSIYPNTCIVVDQKPGEWIMIDIKQPRASRDVPVDSGATIHVMKEYIMKYE